MTKRIERGILSLFFGLCALPALLFAYLGHFSRLSIDEYCTISKGIELGPWQGMLYHLNTHSGGFASRIIFSLIAPLDLQAIVLTLPLLILFWWAASFWFVHQLLGLIGVAIMRRWPSCAIAGALVGMSIAAFPAEYAHYWHSAQIQYISPIILLTVYFALGLWVLRRNIQGRAFIFWVAVGMGICFISAGMHEIITPFQFAFLALSLPAGLTALPRSKVRAYTIFLMAGLAATGIGLFIAASVPGVAVRASSLDPVHTEAYRNMTALLSETAQRVFELAIDIDSYAAFVMLFCLGLFTALTLIPVPRHSQSMPRPQFGKIPLGIALMIQLLLLPLIWQHRSDERQFLGLFSLDYLAIVLLNGLFIATLLIILWQRRRINRALKECPGGWLSFALGVIVLLALPLALGGSRAIHIRASIALLMSWLTMLGLLAYPFAQLSNSEWTKRFLLVMACLYAVSWASNAGLISLELYFAGTAKARTLNTVGWLSALPGLLWGLGLGWALVQQNSRAWQDAAAMMALKWASLAGALIIVAAALLSHGQDIPNFQAYGRDWDARHAQIIAQRDSGKRVIEVAPLPFDLAGLIQRNPMAARIDTYPCAPDYYGVDSIVLTEA